MGKSSSKHNTEDSNSATNIGVVNLSSETLGDGLSVEMILEVLGFIILLVLVLRWIKKCCAKRQMKQKRALREMISNENPFNPQPSAPPPASRMIPLQEARVVQLGSQPALEFSGKQPTREIWTAA